MQKRIEILARHLAKLRAAGNKLDAERLALEVRRLVAYAEAGLQSLSVRYRPAHPAMKAAQARLDALRKQLPGAPESILDPSTGGTY